MGNEKNSVCVTVKVKKKIKSRSQREIVLQWSRLAASTNEYITETPNTHTHAKWSVTVKCAVFVCRFPAQLCPLYRRDGDDLLVRRNDQQPAFRCQRFRSRLLKVAFWQVDGRDQTNNLCISTAVLWSKVTLQSFWQWTQQVCWYFCPGSTIYWKYSFLTQKIGLC